MTSLLMMRRNQYNLLLLEECGAESMRASEKCLFCRRRPHQPSHTSGRKRVRFLLPRRIRCSCEAARAAGERASESARREFSFVRPSVGLVWLVNLGVGVDDKLATMRPPPGDFLVLKGCSPALCAAAPPPAHRARIPLRKTKNSSVALLGSIFE